MRRTLVTLTAALTLLTTPLLTPTAASAAVPGKSFTDTTCEDHTDSIARLYTAGLGREPEQGGFEWWVEEYTAGRWTFPRMAQFFTESPEFAQSYGALDDDGFVRQLYRNILGREGEEGGVAFWLGQMANGMNRATVLMRFAESPENIANSGTVEPALGFFNEGRVPGPWECSQDLSGHLATVLEFDGDRFDPGPDIPTGNECFDRFQLPLDAPAIGVVSGSGDLVMVHSLHAFATPLGAQRFVDGLTDTTPECATFHIESFSPGELRTVTTTVIPTNDSFPGEHVTVTQEFTNQGGGPSYDTYTVAQVGEVVSIVRVGDPWGVAGPGTGSDIAADIATRLALEFT